ncbi:uncharacterized protein LACBIDRAFT_317362 [Laccaria bicolor S238N-H82]|uniref:GPI-anchored wall transfer protein 1 n=1 Tax=Laccaria bicolor (strain S238N-H82 / ATCC MYA-4686) TaxID=486041 RepID=B0D503_LACBS|nr:uncharacterized protein LACBIDRAFT_317362 [Laccaria bicolor S238N-H82]EDR10434.1 predicted protein [Laccaria bicolor S238N-H82]|eukprot:XP_001878884.1 predicted protein [Laccaria bicolor S238N-H82]
MSNDYKAAKEAFVSGMMGSSITHINLVSLVALPTCVASGFCSKATVTNLDTTPAVTTYRAHMMLMTILAILAVDFPVSPRSLAKCETYGMSLMDLGVGSFVFSQGIISATSFVPHFFTPFQDLQSDTQVITSHRSRPWEMCGCR